MRNPYATSVQRRSRRLALWLFVAVLAVASFLGGVLVGVQRTDVEARSFISSLRIGSRQPPRQLNDVADFNQFWELWDYIKTQSLSRNISDVDLFYGAQQGLVGALKDPYSVFLPPRESEDFAEELSGRFDGIGAEIGVKDGRLTVVAPLPGSPAERAGLKSGDAIAAIDGADASNLALDEAISKIRGRRGTTVALTLIRSREVITVTVTRDTIVVPNLKLAFSGDVATLTLYHFNEGTEEEFAQAVRSIQQRGSKKLLLDLRNNPGGFLDAAITLAGYWVPRGRSVVQEQRSDGSTSAYPSEGQAQLAELGTVVLVNGGSASAAEILAGALQDYGLAKLVGQKTFGKGSVQSLRQFRDGSSVKLTVARWLTPSSRQINDVGIEPDVAVEVPSNATSTEADPVLERGMSILNEAR